jgi:4-amino-4-deoxy-L-arabinose transferase-like glycosyltransferase
MSLLSRILVILLLWATWSLRLHNTSALGAQADEGVHVTAAEQMAVGQATLYRDLFENRTPGGEWVLAGLLRLTGVAIFSARVLSVGLATLTVASLYAIGRCVTWPGDKDDRYAPVLGLLAGSFFSLAPLAIFWARFTMLEHFATAAAVISVLLALRAL